MSDSDDAAMTRAVIRMSRIRSENRGMTDLFWLAGAACVLLLLTHIVTIAVAIARCRLGRDGAALVQGPPVSIIRPLCGLEHRIEDTLRSGFELGYGCYELILCVARADDPVIPLAEQLMLEYPAVPAQILIGDDRISANPKLNNVIKGERVAQHRWLMLADSNVLMPRDTIQRALAAFRPDTALVCSPPAGAAPQGFCAEIEAAFFNTYQARWQYFADTIGMGFAQGKTMLWRRADLERIGGLSALAAEMAEDAAATKAVRALGLRVRLTAPPFPQPLGLRQLGEVWRRQARWAQLRRATFPLLFACESVSGFVPAAVAGGVAAAQADLPVAPVLLALALVWYGCEAALAHAARWPLTVLSPLAFLLRDLMVPVVWTHAWFANDFVWRGNEMRTREPPRMARRARELFARLTAS